MAKIDVKATKVIDGIERQACVQYDFGDNLQDAVAKFGEKAVYDDFVASAKITLQAGMRRLLEAGKSEAEIASALATWKPGVKMERMVDPVAALMNKFGTMSEEEQLALIEKLKSMKANG
jgi:hypothetical protein